MLLIIAGLTWIGPTQTITLVGRLAAPDTVAPRILTFKLVAVRFGLPT